MKGPIISKLVFFGCCSVCLDWGLRCGGFLSRYRDVDHHDAVVSLNFAHGDDRRGGDSKQGPSRSQTRRETQERAKRDSKNDARTIISERTENKSRADQSKT